jgi:hypothetical protein
MNWRGWVKMALNQPLLPVLPVARELILKTKLMSSRAQYASQDPFLHPRFFAIDGQQSNTALAEELNRMDSSSNLPHKFSSRHGSSPHIPLTAEPESLEPDQTEERSTRQRVRSLFSRKTRSRSKMRDTPN